MGVSSFMKGHFYLFHIKMYSNLMSDSNNFHCRVRIMIAKSTRLCDGLTEQDQLKSCIATAPYFSYWPRTFLIVQKILS